SILAPLHRRLGRDADAETTSDQRQPQLRAVRLDRDDERQTGARQFLADHAAKTAAVLIENPRPIGQISQRRTLAKTEAFRRDDERGETRDLLGIQRWCDRIVARQIHKSGVDAIRLDLREKLLRPAARN